LEFSRQWQHSISLIQHPPQPLSSAGAAATSGQCEHLAEIDFAAIETDATASGDRDGLDVERIEVRTDWSSFSEE
jgi:hypothetical protein